MTATQLGRIQLLIMQVLWDKKRATAREITDAISEREEIAHSTVQTLLRGLEEKGAVDHAAEGRTRFCSSRWWKSRTSKNRLHATWSNASSVATPPN